MNFSLTSHSSKLHGTPSNNVKYDHSYVLYVVLIMFALCIKFAIFVFRVDRKNKIASEGVLFYFIFYSEGQATFQ